MELSNSRGMVPKYGRSCDRTGGAIPEPAGGADRRELQRDEPIPAMHPQLHHVGVRRDPQTDERRVEPANFGRECFN